MMDTPSIARFVTRYLLAEQCQILEQSPAHITVKLSPQADKDLMNRNFYWSFVERTGATPETTTLSFIFDPEQNEARKNQTTLAFSAQHEPVAKPASEPPDPASSGKTIDGSSSPTSSDSILGRYFGILQPSDRGSAIAPMESEVTFGSSRLTQIFAAAKAQGRYVSLYEKPNETRNSLGLPVDHAIDYATDHSIAYSTWLVVNYKIEFTCDMKRDETLSLGIHLTSGKIAENFHHQLLTREWTPCLPPLIHLERRNIYLPQARNLLEQFLENRLKHCNHQWAAEAHERLNEELLRIDEYFKELQQSSTGEKLEEITTQYRNRQREIGLQYHPRIYATVTNCGLFHFRHGSDQPFDESRQ